jgi:predicted nucleic acid-binding protein
VTAYPDTSFLFSLYVRQVHTPAAIASLGALKAPLPVGSLLQVELTNAIRHAAYRQTITAQEALRSLAAWELDLENGVFVTAPVPWERVHGEAERLSHAHTLRDGCRTFDILHVATAVHLGAREFLTFDASQRKLATAAGLKVKP